MTPSTTPLGMPEYTVMTSKVLCKIVNKSKLTRFCQIWSLLQ